VTADVVVCGGGPGGSTFATLMARSGYRTVVFEREVKRAEFDALLLATPEWRDCWQLTSDV
jgi:flavin-dependent dehydrogenase